MKDGVRLRILIIQEWEVYIKIELGVFEECSSDNTNRSIMSTTVLQVSPEPTTGSGDPERLSRK